MKRKVINLIENIATENLEKAFEELKSAIRNPDIKDSELNGLFASSITTYPRLLFQKDDDSKTLYMFLAEYDRPFLIKFATTIASAPELINLKDNDHMSALMYAAGKNSIETAKALVEAGADITLKTKNKNSAIFYAGLHTIEVAEDSRVFDYLLDMASNLPEETAVAYLKDAIEAFNQKETFYLQVQQIPQQEIEVAQANVDHFEGIIEKSENQKTRLEGKIKSSNESIEECNKEIERIEALIKQLQSTEGHQETKEQAQLAEVQKFLNDEIKKAEENLTQLNKELTEIVKNSRELLKNPSEENIEKSTELHKQMLNTQQKIKETSNNLDQLWERKDSNQEELDKLEKQNSTETEILKLTQVKSNLTLNIETSNQKIKGYKEKIDNLKSSLINDKEMLEQQKSILSEHQGEVDKAKQLSINLQQIIDSIQNKLAELNGSTQTEINTAKTETNSESKKEQTEEPAIIPVIDEIVQNMDSAIDEISGEAPVIEVKEEDIIEEKVELPATYSAIQEAAKNEDYEAMSQLIIGQRDLSSQTLGTQETKDMLNWMIEQDIAVEVAKNELSKIEIIELMQSNDFKSVNIQIVKSNKDDTFFIDLIKAYTENYQPQGWADQNKTMIKALMQLI